MGGDSRAGSGKARFIRSAFLVLALGFMLLFLVRNNPSGMLELEPSLRLLVPSALLVIGANGAVAATCWWLLTVVGEGVSYREVLRVFLLSNLGKYIPGKIWSYFSMLYVLESRGTARKVAISTMLVWQCVIFIAALLVSLLLVPESRVLAGWGTIYFVSGTGAVLASLAVLWPGALERAVNAGQRMRGQQRIELPQFSRGDVAVALAVSVVQWLMYSFAFFLFCKSIVVMPWSAWMLAMGGFALASVAGYLAPFAPAGLGVREGVLAVVLTAVLPVATATMVVLAARVWMVVVEVGFTLAVMGFGPLVRALATFRAAALHGDDPGLTR